MMMMRTAGGPTAPLWTRDARKPKLPTWMWAAAVLSVGAHLGAGVWLMSQRWTPPEVIMDPPDRPFVLLPPPRKKVEPEPVERAQATPAQSTPLNKTPAPTIPTETLVYEPSDTATQAEGPIALKPLPDARPDGAGTTETSEPTRLGVVTHPDWVQRPTGEALMRAYPNRAPNAGITGSAQLSCVVRVDGTLTACSVADETPSGQGFGRAALRLSRDFRMSPRTIDGQAVEGARVSVTLRFTLPE